MPVPRAWSRDVERAIHAGMSSTVSYCTLLFARACLSYSQLQLHLCPRSSATDNQWLERKAEEEEIVCPPTDRLQRAGRGS